MSSSALAGSEEVQKLAAEINNLTDQRDSVLKELASTEKSYKDAQELLSRYEKLNSGDQLESIKRIVNSSEEIIKREKKQVDQIETQTAKPLKKLVEIHEAEQRNIEELEKIKTVAISNEIAFWRNGRRALIPRSVGPPTEAKVVEKDGSFVKVEWSDSNGTYTKRVHIDSLEPVPGSKDQELLNKVIDHLASIEKKLSQTEAFHQLISTALHSIAKRNPLGTGNDPAGTAALDPNIISQEQCEGASFDNSKLMGPDTDQGQSKLCWAHATAALLEEQLCLATKNLPKGSGNYCNERVARAEIAGRVYEKQDSIHLTVGEGGSGKRALEYYLSPDGGKMEVCLDKYGKNPYDTQDSDYIDQLISLFIHYRQFNQECSNQDTTSNRFFSKLIADHKNIQDFLERDSSSWTMQKDDNQRLDEFKLLKLLQESKNADQFAQSTLLYYCKGTARKSFNRPGIRLKVTHKAFQDPAYSPEEDKGDFRKISVDKYLSEFLNAKRSGNSLYLSVCYYPLIRNLGLRQGKGASELDGRNTCGSHGIVANAMRWNPHEHRCEVHIKNSHGADTRLRSTWYPAEGVFAHVLSASYFTNR